MASFGQALKRLREARGLTQRAVATGAEMDYSYYSRLENDRFTSRPTRPTVDRLGRALRLQAAERQQLLTAAGRFDPGAERLMRVVSTRPELARLLRAAARLPAARVAALTRAAEEAGASESNGTNAAGAPTHEVD